jgi:uncharacterized protein (DUF433 family)
MSKGTRYPVTPLIEFWKIGKNSRKELMIAKSGGKKGEGETETRYVHGSKQTVKEELAAKYRLNHDMLGKAWRIAEQYTEDQIRHWDELVKKCDASFWSCHLKDLLVVTDRKKRDRLMEKAIRKNWSTKQLYLTIQAKFGRRAHVGRKPKVPENPQELMTKLRMLCDKWINFCKLAEAECQGKLAASVKNATASIHEVKELADKSLTRLRG